MLAVITFAFAGGIYKRKKYLFKTDIQNLKHGEMVMVEGVKKGEQVLAMFHRYSEEDWFPGMRKKNVVKRAHWKTVQSFVQKRQAQFANYALLPRAASDLRALIPEYKGLTDEELRKLVIQRITVSAKTYKKNNIILYLYDKISIVTVHDKIINVTINRKPEFWKSPAQLEKYLV